MAPGDAVEMSVAVRDSEVVVLAAARPDAPLEELGDYWQGTDGLLRRATAHIYRRIIAPQQRHG